jgi:photosystem II stability/assembly factor-like uncharacterized protein
MYFISSNTLHLLTFLNKRYSFFLNVTKSMSTLIVAALFLSPWPLLASWTQPHQSYQGSLAKIKMVNASVGYAVGGDQILKTSDGGSSWKGLSVQYPKTAAGDYSALLDLSFPTTSVGYVVGYSSTIFKTMDGGNTWLQLNVSNNKGAILCVHFTSADMGYIGDETGKLFKTTNGGATWTALSTSTTTAINCLYFIDANTGWFSGNNGVIKKTSDGGDNWTSQNSGTTSAIKSMVFYSSNNGWVATSTSIIKTTNGGSNWSTVNSSQTSINHIYFADANTGWVTSFDFPNTIKKTTDGGSTWSTQYSGPNNTAFSSIYFISSTIGYAVGANTAQVLKTTNGGTNWSLVNTPNLPNNNYAVHFLTSSSDGWMVGDQGTVLKSSDGGNSWTSQTSGTTILLTGVYANSTSVAWFCGLSGLIKKTTDGGSNWTTQTSGLTVTLYDIEFIDANNGLCVGDQGKILKTTNGGSTWTSITNTSSTALRSIFYATSNIVYIVGHGGVILKSTDGGSSWSAQTSGTSNNLIGSHFVSSTEGYACGAGGTILKTTNGGTNWAAQTTNTTKYFTKMVFNGTKNGWAVGQDGMISRTKDGGSNWVANKMFTTLIINAIALVNNGDLVAACQSGAFGRFKESCPPAAPTSYNTNYQLSICVNTKTTLLAVGEGKISWYTSASGGTYLGSGESFTTGNLNSSATFYAQDSTCSASNSRTAITVVPTAPTITSITHGENCGAGQITLKATASSGNVNWFTANSGGSTLSTGTSFTTPTLTNSATYYVEANENNCVSSNRTAVNATIKAFPTISNTSPNERCGSGTVTLNASASAGNIKWYDAMSGGNLLGTGNAFITPNITITTTYYAEAVDGNCISNSRSSVNATINDRPTVTANSTATVICAGGIITLTGGGADAYTWNGGISNGVAFAPTASGTFTVIGKNAKNCADTASIDITVNPLPNVNTSLNGATITALKGEAFYQWINCSDKAIIQGETKQSFTPKTNGNYAVIVTQNNCSDTSDCVSVQLGKVRGDLFKGISIQPNPSHGHFTIKGINQGYFTLTNGNGQVISTFELNSLNDYTFVFDNLSTGFYLINGQSENQFFSKKLIVIQ